MACVAVLGRRAARASISWLVMLGWVIVRTLKAAALSALLRL